MKEAFEDDKGAQDNSTEITRETINIRMVFASKNPKVARLIPGFVYRYLQRIVHQDETNRFLYDHRDQFGLDFVNAVIRYFNLKITVHGMEHIPPTGKVTVVSNHPLGGLDGLAVIQTLGKVRPDITTVVNDLIMFLPNLRPLCVPVNKHGNSAAYITQLNETFAAENIIPIFPAGLCSRKQSDGVIHDLEWKSTFIIQAKRNQRLVLPVHFSGRNSNFFYNLARLRKRLGIKTNIEMFYLPNEMFKQRNNEVVITIGEPITPETFDKTKKPLEWAQWVKDRVYELGNRS
jgi:1-acyl-sn-glycerol-3-phosphate acyltransferase